MTTYINIKLIEKSDAEPPKTNHSHQPLLWMCLLSFSLSARFLIRFPSFIPFALAGSVAAKA
jgi:hypothetical protein